jgi:hypothetical protein
MASVVAISSLRRKVLNIGRMVRYVTMVLKFQDNFNLEMRVLQAA